MKYISSFEENWDLRIEKRRAQAGVDLSIVIPVHNNVHFTKAALEDLLQLPHNHEIIIVNNASTDSTWETTQRFFETRNLSNARLVHVHCPRNLGFGRANNKGYKHSLGKNILFLNNDIRVRTNKNSWTQEIIALCEQRNLISANGGLLSPDFQFVRETTHRVESPWFYLSGWCIGASRETFDRLILDHYSHDQTDLITEGKAWGPWNEKFFAYFEDPDLTWRAQELNIPIEVINVPVHHFGRMTSKKLGLSKMYSVSQEICKQLWSEKKK